MPEEWEVRVKAWQEDGTIDRLQEAKKNKTPVKIDRSDGSVSDGVIVEVYHGLLVEVGFETPDGTRYRKTRTQKFLDLNPQFAAKDKR